MHHKGVAHRAI